LIDYLTQSSLNFFLGENAYGLGELTSEKQPVTLWLKAPNLCVSALRVERFLFFNTRVKTGAYHVGPEFSDRRVVELQDLPSPF